MAIKVIDKRIIISNKSLAAEVSVLKRLDHPNIVNLIDAFITEDSLQMVMELYVDPNLEYFKEYL